SLRAEPLHLGPRPPQLAAAARRDVLAAADRARRRVVLPAFDPALLRSVQLPDALRRTRAPGPVDAGAGRPPARVRGRGPVVSLGHGPGRAQGGAATRAPDE